MKQILVLCVLITLIFAVLCAPKWKGADEVPTYEECNKNYKELKKAQLKVNSVCLEKGDNSKKCIQAKEKLAALTVIAELCAAYYN